MKDVAERCGVAESTVSHVINGTRFVSPEMREKVLEAMRELNYYGNAHARRLARGSSDFLGLIISDIENPFFPGLIKAFESAALTHGYDVLLSTTNYEAARTEKSFRKMIENLTPGVAVMTSRVHAEMAELLDQNEVASVFLDAGMVVWAAKTQSGEQFTGSKCAVTQLPLRRQSALISVSAEDV